MKMMMMNDEDAEDEDVYMYPTDMHPNEREHIDLQFVPQKHLIGNVNNMRIL
ncbi:hypothetical protein CK203_094033 [Vitis vinifera]|uniref:Uncharacterized protein n=1 Tax=Vitis vinifera TaxID=29760 RepID=A0A438BRT2_VITVI|nr:hypothetical protein CK203_094033 [Vitis vinifera]